MSNNIAYVDDQTRETQIKTNSYKYGDTVSTNMTNSQSHVTDQTTETQIRSYKTPEHENKVLNNDNQTMWNISNEHESKKAILTSRTGGIEPTNMDIPKSNDFESFKQSNVFGKKSIRGDRLQYDDSVIGESISQ